MAVAHGCGPMAAAQPGGLVLGPCIRYVSIRHVSTQCGCAGQKLENIDHRVDRSLGWCTQLCHTVHPARAWCKRTEGCCPPGMCLGSHPHDAPYRWDPALQEYVSGMEEKTSKPVVVLHFATNRPSAVILLGIAIA